MRILERAVILGAALLLLLLFLYPPYMSIDPESQGRVHGGLGHHPVWNPPTPEFTFRALYPNATEIPDAGRLAEFVPRINRVRLTLNALTIGLAGGLALWGLVRRRRRINRR